MMVQAISKATVGLDVEAADWRAAIRAVGLLLVQAGTIENSYVDAMIRYVDTKGPYVVVAPGVAMPHASPNDGAGAVGLAVVRLSTPIPFGHQLNDPVDLLFCLASPDFTSHIQVLVGLTSLLEDAGALGRLRAAQDAAAVVEVVASAI